MYIKGTLMLRYNVLFCMGQFGYVMHDINHMNWHIIEHNGGKLCSAKKRNR